MLIKIINDVHDVTTRLKEIDKNYFIVYNSNKSCFEVHNYSQKNTYCLTVPYNQLDCRTIELTLKTRREFIDKILAEIDENNERLEQENNKVMRDLSQWKLKEMYDYANRHDSNDFNDAYKTKWA